MVDRTRRPRSTPDFDAVTRITADLLVQHGESGFRIDDVQKATGASKSSLYAQFGDRDGLITAGLLLLYEEHYHETIGAFDEIIRTSRTREDFLRQLEQLLDVIFNLNRTPQRLQRIAVLAGTATRPDLRTEVAKLHTAMIDDYTRSLELAQVREFAFFNQPPRVIANVVASVILGRVLSAYDNSLPDDDQKQWVDAGMAILRALLNL